MSVVVRKRGEVAFKEGPNHMPLIHSHPYKDLLFINLSIYSSLLPLLFYFQHFTHYFLSCYPLHTVMEGKNQSFTDLFGAKESQPSSSTGIFATMFPPPSSSHVRNEAWNPQHAHAASARSGEGTNGSKGNKKKNSNVEEERVEPCHLSSSLYYGGQDIYSQSPVNQTPASYPKFKKDGGEDHNGNNSPSASRGNWWQGSLYY